MIEHRPAFRGRLRPHRPGPAPTSLVRGALVGLGLSLATWSATPARAQDLMAVTGHFLHHSRFYPQYGPYWRVDLTLPFVKELGVKTVHEAIYALGAMPRALVTMGKTDPATLKMVEANRKLVDEWLSAYDASGVKVVMAAIAYPPSTRGAAQTNSEFFAWFSDVVAAHPSIISVQLHNEPNLTHFWKGTPEEYVDTYRPLALAIKAKRPDVKIAGGAISSLWWGPGIGWLKRAVDHGLLDFVDSIAVHPYNENSPPEIDPHWRGAPMTDPDHREKALLAFWQQLQSWNRSGKRLDLVFTEFGWNTATEGRSHVDEATQADYLARSFLIFQDIRLRGVPLTSAHWYDLKDDGQQDGKGEHRYGLINYDLTRRKPAFEVLKALNAFFGHTDDFQPSELKSEVVAPMAPVKAKFWRRKSDGAEIAAFWSTAMDGAGGAGTKATLRIPGLRSGTAKLFFADERRPQIIAINSRDNAGEIEIEAGSRPSWVEIKRR